MSKAPQVNDIVRIDFGHHKGMLARVAELNPDHQLIRLELTRNNGMWMWAKHVTVTYRPNLIAA